MDKNAPNSGRCLCELLLVKEKLITLCSTYFSWWGSYCLRLFPTDFLFLRRPSGENRGTASNWQQQKQDNQAFLIHSSKKETPRLFICKFWNDQSTGKALTSLTQKNKFNKRGVSFLDECRCVYFLLSFVRWSDLSCPSTWSRAVQYIVIKWMAWRCVQKGQMGSHWNAKSMCTCPLTLIGILGVFWDTRGMHQSFS